MVALNIFTATIDRSYENNLKKINEEKDLCQLYVKRNLWRSARFLYASSLCPDYLSHYNVVLFSIDHGFLNSTQPLTPDINKLKRPGSTQKPKISA